MQGCVGPHEETHLEAVRPGLRKADNIVDGILSFVGTMSTDDPARPVMGSIVAAIDIGRVRAKERERDTRERERSVVEIDVRIWTNEHASQPYPAGLSHTFASR